MAVRKGPTRELKFFARTVKFGRIAGYAATLIILTAAVTVLISELPEPRLLWGVEDISVEAGILVGEQDSPSDKSEKREYAFSRSIEDAREIKKHLQEGKKLYGRMDYKGAIAEWRKILAINPGHNTAKKLIEKSEKIHKKRQDKWTKIEIKEEPLVYHVPTDHISLEDAIEIAIQNHLPLQVAEEDIKLANLRLFEANRNVFPSLSARLDEFDGISPSGSKYKGKKYIVEGEQPIYHGGELLYKIKQAKVNLEISNENYRKVRDELVLQVRAAYYDLARAKSDMDYQKELVQEVWPVFEVVGKGKDSGVMTEVQYLNVRSQYNQARFQVIAAQESLSLAKIRLAQVMNVDPNDKFEIDYELPLRKVNVDLEDALNLALENRPELIIQDLTRRSSYYDRAIAKSATGPKVDFTGSYGKAGEAERGVDLNTTDEWYIGTRVSWPIGGNTAEYNFAESKSAPSVGSFQGTNLAQHTAKISLLDDFTSVTNDREKRIEYQKARYQYAEARKKVVTDVNEAFYNFQKSLVQLDAANTAIEFREKEALIFKTKQELGEGSFSDFVESQLKLAQARSSHVKALADYYTAVASMNRAIGIEDYYNF